MSHADRMFEIQAEYEADERADDEAEKALYLASHETLLRAFASLTHRMHEGNQNLRAQRDRVEAEILRRMR